MTWEDIIDLEKQKDYYKSLEKEINKRYETTTVFPEKKNIFKELDQIRGSAMPVLGKYLGYPSCCINDFMKNFGRKKVISRSRFGCCS